MPSQFDPIDSSEPKHIAIFPPATHCACKLETWSDTPIKTACGPIVADKNSLPAVFSREEEEPERWDGMS